MLFLLIHKLKTLGWCAEDVDTLGKDEKSRATRPSPSAVTELICVPLRL